MQKPLALLTKQGRCENPECRNITEYGGISRNMAEYHGISRHFPGIYLNITIFSDGSHATVYKHGRLITTYFITKVMDLSQVTNNNSILEILYLVYIIITSVHQKF
jgi:hypothetical protein